MPPTLFSRPGRPGHGKIKDLSVPAFSRHLVMLLLVNSKTVLGQLGGSPGKGFWGYFGPLLGVSLWGLSGGLFLEVLEMAGRLQ